MPEIHRASCACGQVRVEAEGPPINVRTCHCRLCQKVTGQASWSRALFAADKIAIDGEVKRYASSEDLDRGFCPSCGTTLLAFRASTQVVSVTLGAMEPPGALAPSMHIWTSRKLPWVCVEEGVDQHPGAAPA